MVHLPYFLPDDWTEGIEDVDPSPSRRPYLAAAGRLVRMKGFQQLIPLMRLLPEVDLLIAGTGPYEAKLRQLAADVPNVKFVGLLGGQGARPAVPRGPGRRGPLPLPRDLRLRRPGSLRRPDPGDRPRRGWGDPGDRRRERRRARLP